MKRTTTLIVGLAGSILATPVRWRIPGRMRASKGITGGFMTIAARRDGCDRGRPRYRPDIFHLLASAERGMRASRRAASHHHTSVDGTAHQPAPSGQSIAYSQQQRKPSSHAMKASDSLLAL